MTYRLCNTLTFARRMDDVDAIMQQYEALGYRHTGRMTKDKLGLEKGVYRYNPSAPTIWHDHPRNRI